MNEMLSQYQNEKSTTSSEFNRGSRLKCIAGLNITKDEDVLLKFKQEDKKQT